MVDFYTKTALTVIAGALITLVIQNSIKPVYAQLGSCGSDADPCVVRGPNPEVVSAIKHTKNPVFVRMAP